MSELILLLVPQILPINCCGWRMRMTDPMAMRHRSLEILGPPFNNRCLKRCNSFVCWFLYLSLAKKCRRSWRQCRLVFILFLMGIVFVLELQQLILSTRWNLKLNSIVLVTLVMVWWVKALLLRIGERMMYFRLHGHGLNSPTEWSGLHGGTCARTQIQSRSMEWFLNWLCWLKKKKLMKRVHVLIPHSRI